MSKDSIELRAPAKINLSFRIKGRRADGFHEIETWMTPISLFDRLVIERINADGEIDFRCHDPTLPESVDNLVVRAARLFLRTANLRTGLRLELEKAIPHGAGLGGGSSDAAATLLGLNELLKARFDEEKLAKIGAGIGSDVPFFIYERAAICRGRGELVTPASLPRPLRLLLLKPAFGVSTPWAYACWNDSRDLPGIDYRPQEFRGITFVNDLERPVFAKHLFLAHMKLWLRQQAEVEVAMMSGSGSTLFAVLGEHADGKALAARAAVELDQELWNCACETLEVKSVAAACERD